MSTHDWIYARTNSKGVAIFRKETGQTLSHCMDYLKANDVKYDVVESAKMLRVYSKANRMYVYYWTTGRWSPRRHSSKKHYHSNGIEDFVEKYLNKYADEHIREDTEEYEDSETFG